jgi:ABC-type transport system involved in multi-copper enzyme maturation permease subunit
MNAIVKQLVWKEFQEQKWAVAGVAAVALAIPLSYVFRDVNMALMGVGTCLVIYPVAAGIFFGTRAAAGERAHRSASFAAALPVSHRLLGMTRLLSALVAAIIPLLALLILAGALSPFGDESARVGAWPLLLMFTLAVLATIWCLAISAAAGLGQTTEIRAGVVGLMGILVTWIVGFSALIMVNGFLVNQHAVAPKSTRFIVTVGSSLMALAVTVLATEAFIGRYSLALGAFVGPNVKGWVIPRWNVQIFSAPVSALIGKAVREMGLLGLEVLGISLLLSVLVGLISMPSNNHAEPLTRSLTAALPMILLVAGYVLAVLIGVGAVIGDVQPGVNTFWRSRPISPSAWYWTKYGVGLATMLVAVEIPAVVLVGPDAGHVFRSERGVSWWLLMWDVTFSFALTATCLVRQPGYAAILAIGGVSVLYAVIEAAFGSFMPGEASAPMDILGPVFVVAFFVSTAIGWWGAARDVSVA